MTMLRYKRPSPASYGTADFTARLRALVRQMQAVLLARRMVRTAGFPLLTAAVLDTRLRLAGVWIVEEMRRVEGSVTAA